jgi:hypothetical protein
MELTEIEITKLEEKLLDVLYDRKWCQDNRIDYCNPDVNQARKIIYGR